MSETTSDSTLNQAVAEGGAYELIRKRLLQQGKTLDRQVQTLNEQREAEFGQSAMVVIGRMRVRTDNNCVPRDIVRVGPFLLFGYNVFIGLKRDTKISDVFSLYELIETEEGFDVSPIAQESTFLADPKFIQDFKELYSYYKHAHLLQLQVKREKLLATFQIGSNIADIRVFRWGIDHSGQAAYIDNRGERDAVPPPTHDFEWKHTGRDDQISGKHPHISILDELFVETINGDLTIKVENNTEEGFGIYHEPVEEQHQSLDDADILYAKAGLLILLKIRPYREEGWRYLVFNTRTQTVTRIDAIGQTCVQLSEDHGIIFPGGYYLQSGDNKSFGDEMSGFQLKRTVRSPNGEDVLYVFYEPVEGKVALFCYNLIRKALLNPIYGHGYCLYEDGRAVIFRAESDEPTRVHPMQIWQTPFYSEDHAGRQPAGHSALARIGNAELVRGISDLFGIARAISSQTVSAAGYEALIAGCRRLFDSYFWLPEEAVGNLEETLTAIVGTAEQVLDEFEKVEQIQKQAERALAEAETAQNRLIERLQSDDHIHPQQFVEGLSEIRQQRGHLLSLKEQRYIDLTRVDELEHSLIEEQDSLSGKTVRFLSQPQSLAPYRQDIEEALAQLDRVETVAACRPLQKQLDAIGTGLDLLTELLGSLKVEDATQRTAILEAISEVYARLNQAKARTRSKRKTLGTGEATAEFGAQFTLLSQSIAGALGLAETPEQCDEQLARLLIQLEELESRFGEHDAFLADILEKREELYQTFESRKQALLDQRQRRAQTLANAGDRLLAGIQRRAQNFTEADVLNAYFASDPMVLKNTELSQQLRRLDDPVKADDLEARLKAIKEQAIRALRDKRDIFDAGGQVIRLGRHRFSVNTQLLDLTIVGKQGQMMLHLTGTDYFEPIDDPQMTELAAYWDQPLISETAQVYRAEYLAALLLDRAERSEEGLTLDELKTAALDEAELIRLVRRFAAPRYQEGYEKGVHDTDCAKILAKLLPLREQAGLLRFSPAVRALAVIYWDREGSSHPDWPVRAHSAQQLSGSLASHAALDALADDVQQNMQKYCDEQELICPAERLRSTGRYLVQQLISQPLAFVASHQADRLSRGLVEHLDTIGHHQAWLQTLEQLHDRPDAQWALAEAWIAAWIESGHHRELGRFVPEAAALLITNIEHTVVNVPLQTTVGELLGDHPRIRQGSLELAVDEFFERLHHHMHVVVPEYRQFHETRQTLIDQQRTALQLEQYQAKPLTSFVRNRLIDESYLPIVGDNLAKQMGTVGKNKRTDLMGLLMLISPPGYGKTTLMEYIANRLGLIFMKINCPSLGHSVRSIDPGNAPNATARQELEKLNLGLEMGNNVMLYLDDIQHTHSEFLQKFIALCDGTRRIEGVWRGNSTTYDLRGKKFCVVMAGNPYTESGELFKIPDMLANRADIYNLGDILSGQDDIFALSYIENALTSNPVLSPLATRDMADVYKLIGMARGEAVAVTDLSHAYSAAEVNEIIGVLRKLFVVQKLLLSVNQAYIASAATADDYRTEPHFKLQGSYRNMNKIAEKVVAIMSEEELQAVISDHYNGEAQLLTTGAEENLLKLGELRGTLTAEDTERWQSIKRDYARIRSTGGDDVDPATKVARQIAAISEQLQSLQSTIREAAPPKAVADNIQQQIDVLQRKLSERPVDVTVINEPVPGMEKAFSRLAETIDTTFMPVVAAMNRKIDLDLNILHKVGQLSADLKEWKNNSGGSVTRSEVASPTLQETAARDADEGSTQ
jgi:ATPase involved in DNA repair/ATPase family associated with various cellular activities (AAA)